MRSFNALRAPAGSEGWSNGCSPEERTGAADPLPTFANLDSEPQS
jgi:hypothetical protein